MSGGWLAIVQGFAGMRLYNNTLSFKPYCPEKWTGYSFTVQYRGRTIKVNAKTRDIYTAYRKAGYSRKYYDAHESDILIHKAAKKVFDDLALKKLPTVKSLQAEYSDLLVQKKLDYAELSKARDEAKQLQIYKANAEMLLRTDAEEQRQTRERQQEK